MTNVLTQGCELSVDERRVRAHLAAAIEELKNVHARDRARVRERIGHLSTELARVLTRTGREHLASALVSDDVPHDA